MIKNKLVFSIVNDEQKHISIKMTMNDKDPVWEQEFFTAEDNVAAEFDYNYTEPYNWLTIYFTGDEQRNKLFAIKSVSINNQKLQVNCTQPKCKKGDFLIYESRRQKPNYPKNRKNCTY